MGLLGLGQFPRLSAQHFPRPRGLALPRLMYQTVFWTVLVSIHALSPLWNLLSCVMLPVGGWGVGG